jgi:hypothetical protein
MTHFDYLLNAFEQASQADNPAKEGYAEKRRALLAYVRELESYKQDAERYRWLRDNGDGFEITVREVNEDGGEEWIAGYSGPELDIAIDTARKGEGE